MHSFLSRRRSGVSSLLRALAFGLLFTALAAHGQTDPSATDDTNKPAEKKGPTIAWQRGPVKAKLGDIAELNLPAGYVFADVANTKTLLELTQNIPSGKELGAVAGVGSNWFAVFEFEPVGYVKDDEKDKLDADKLLKTIQDATEEGNKAKKDRGWGTFTVTGWIEPPHYDTRTNQLAWSLVGHDEKGSESANYLTRALGRRGVMSMTLIVDPKSLSTVLPKFQSIASTDFSFTPDNR